MSDQTKDPEILTRDDGSMIAYRHTAGKSPGVTFLTGFKSDMQGGKATTLETFCTAKGHAFTRFDYFGHGESSGAFEDGTIGRWADDTVHVLDTVTEGPQVLVGSSMGGWIMLHVALALGPQISGMIGIAAAPDFTRDLMWRDLTAEQRQTLNRDGIILLDSEHDSEGYPVTKAFIEDGEKNLLMEIL